VLKPGSYAPDGVPLVRILDIESDVVDETALFRISRRLDEQFERSRLDGGELLVSIQGTIGRVAIATDRIRGANISRTIARVAISGEAEARFVRHWLLSERGHKALTDATVGTTRASLNLGDLRRITLSTPPLNEQRMAADIIDTLDRAIRYTGQLIAKLDQMKQGLVRDLLVRGIDDNGEIRNADKYPEQFKESAFGLIPRVWSTPTIGSLAVHVGSGITPRGGRDVYRESGVLFIRSQNVHFGGLRLGDAVYIDGAMHHAMARSEVYPNDVLMNITGASIGRCCTVPAGIGPANVNQHVCAVRLAGAKRNDAEFLAAFLASPSGQRQVIVLNAGSNRQGLNYEQLRSFVVVWPGASERAAIAEVLGNVDGRREAEKRALDKLRLLKAGLAEDLLTGRVRVTKLLEGSAA
jgi:type I restriction enzyme S subunit